jgi:LuxR family maltose regulon positive regulatory protein
MIALYRAALAAFRGDTEGTSAFASRVLAEIGEGESMLEAYARGHLAMAEWLRGRLPAAEQALGATIAQWRAAGERFLAVRYAEFLGQAQRGQGRLDAALATYRQALEDVGMPGRPGHPALAAIAHVGMAGVLYERGELAAALNHVTEGIELCRRFIQVPPLATGLVTLAWIRQATGDPAGALAAMDEAGRDAPSPDLAALLNPVPAQRARLALAQGDIAAAAHWTDQRGLDPDDEPSYAREPEYLVLARVLLAEQTPERALGLVERWLTLAVTQGRTGSIIELRALQALALAASGDERGALAALAEALALARPEGYLRVFVDEGAPMATLLGAGPPGALASQVPLDYLRRLTDAFQQAGVASPRQGRRGAVPGLVEPLSERELEVLGLLAVGRSNQQIADELVVALDTAKKHVSHILDKLGVANRTQAVARARQLELLR